MKKIPKKGRLILAILVGIGIIVGIITIINSYRFPQYELRKLYNVLLILLSIIGIGTYLHYRPDIVEKFEPHFIGRQYYEEDDEYSEEYSERIIQYPFPQDWEASSEFETSEGDKEEDFE